MKKIFSKSSRRLFLEHFTLVSTAFVVFPTVSLAKNPLNLLQFLILGEDSVLRHSIEKLDKMMIVDDLKSATVIYVSKFYQKSQNHSQEILTSGKYLIIEDHETNELLIENGKKLGNSFSVVERSKDSSKLFEKTDYYENNNLQIFDFQKVMDILAFLEQHTKPLAFKIENDYKPVKIPIS